MTARENALEIIRFGRPDRITTGPPVHWLTYRGCNHQGYDDTMGDDHPTGSVWTDVWGTRWHKEQPGVMGMVVECPLDEPSRLSRYRWPDPDDPRICGSIDAAAEKNPGGDLFLGGQHRDTLWEKAYMLVGMEAMMIYFHSEPAFAREVLHRIMDFQLGIAAHYLRHDVEIVSLGDDLGTQTGALLGPAIVDEFLVPEYRRLFDLYRKHGVIVNFHSCGNVDSVLDRFIDLGVDILNPVQATANDLDRLRERTQGRMALQGGVSSATVMSGPPEAVISEARARMWQLGRDGGYFCRPDQGMPYPPEHLEALENAVREDGAYPLEPPGRG